MIYLEQIIEELVDSKSSLSGPLLKTKVLAHKLKSQELLNWINSELNGYQSDNVVPSYRIIGCNVTGSWINGQWKATNNNLPIMHLEKEVQEALRTIPFSNGISSLESFITDNAKGIIYMPVPPELGEYIAETFRDAGNPFFTMTGIRKEISVSGIQQILGYIRNKLMDFILKLDEEYGSIDSLDDLAKTDENINEKITIIMSQTINNSGDGNIINTGDKNTFNSSITINKGDIEAFKQFLESYDIDKKEIDEISSIVKEEEPDKENKRFGQKTNDWIKKMIDKALNGTWQVGIGAAGTILAEAIKSYYGM